MRRLVPILIACLALLAGCARPLVDTRITDVGLVSLTPNGFRSADAVVRLDVSNPGPAFTLREVQGTVKRGTEPFLHLTAPDLTVDRQKDSSYLVPLHGQLDAETSILQLLTTPNAWNPDEVTIDFSARVGVGRSSGKTIEYKDIPLRTLIERF